MAKSSRVRPPPSEQDEGGDAGDGRRLAARPSSRRRAGRRCRPCSGRALLREVDVGHEHVHGAHRQTGEALDLLLDRARGTAPRRPGRCGRTARPSRCRCRRSPRGCRHRRRPEPLSPMRLESTPTDPPPSAPTPSMPLSASCTTLTTTPSAMVTPPVSVPEGLGASVTVSSRRPCRGAAAPAAFGPTLPGGTSQASTGVVRGWRLARRRSATFPRRSPCVVADRRRRSATLREPH